MKTLLVFAFHAHTRPSNAPTALVSCYLEAVFIHVGLEPFPDHVTFGDTHGGNTSPEKDSQLLNKSTMYQLGQVESQFN